MRGIGIRAGLDVLVFKGEDESFSFRFGMLGSRAMAGLTPFLEMPSLLLQGIVQVRVAPLAGFGSYGPFRLGLLLSLTERIETNEGYRSE
jgi:hypothetical protein